MPIHMAVFVKRPQPGRVKTRLGEALGADGATSLYTAMLWDTVTAATKSEAAGGWIFHEGPDPRAWLPELPAGWMLAPQTDGDLGTRLAAAAELAADRGAMPLLILGSDSPDLPIGLLNQALGALAGRDLVLGPTPDGGVWCIGLRRTQPGLFVEIPWSQASTGAALRNRADQLGLKQAELPVWQDVDVLQDLLDLATRLADSRDDAPATRRWLAEHEGPWQQPQLCAEPEEPR